MIICAALFIFIDKNYGSVSRGEAAAETLHIAHFENSVRISEYLMFESLKLLQCLYLLRAEWRLLKPLDFLSVGVDHPEELSGSRHSTE